MSHPRVRITEEALREGMQIESTTVSVESRLRLIDALASSGLERIVVGSFVRPEYTPQMACVDELAARLRPRPGVAYTAIALNEKGRRRRAAHMPPLEEVSTVPTLFCHMCDTFPRRNANVARDDEIATWPDVVADAVAAGARQAGIGVGAAFGSNFEGGFDLASRMAVLRRQHALWRDAGIPVTALFLFDPMSWCTPQWVGEQLLAVLHEWPTIVDFHVHLHNARGLALASAYEAIRTLDGRHTIHLDTAAGGIGGCPYCGNGEAAGMVATEDLVNMLETMGIATGVDLEALVRAVWLLEEMIGRPTLGHVSKAGPHPGRGELYDPNLPRIETLAEARHFLDGAAVAAHQRRPWRDPIPAPLA